MAKTNAQLEEESKAAVKRIAELEAQYGESVEKLKSATLRIAELEKTNQELREKNNQVIADCDMLRLDLAAAKSAPKADTMLERIGAAEKEAAKVIMKTRPAPAPEGITEDQIRAKIKESGHQLKRNQAIAILQHQAEQGDD